MKSLPGGAKWFPVAYLNAYLTEGGFPGSVVSDPDYDAMFEAAGAATTIEEQNRINGELNQYVIEKSWTIWGPLAPQYHANWPWLKGFNGEFMLGNGQYSVFARVWIDQDLKQAMGH